MGKSNRIKILKKIRDNKTLIALIMFLLLLFIVTNHPKYIFISFIAAIVLSILMDKIDNIIVGISIKKFTTVVLDSNYKLAKSENRFKNLFYNLHTIICIFDLEKFRFVDCNNYFCEVTGYNNEELKEISPKKIILQEDLKASIDAVKNNLNGQNIKEMTNRYICKNGNIIKIKWIFSDGDENNISFCVGQLID
jgi:PAS domain S-box-containing protein